MPEMSMSLVHRCGALVPDGATLCTGCGRPLMVIPESIREMSKDTEELTGMDRIRVSLLGVLTAAYTQGWDDAMEAVRNAETSGEPDGANA